MSGETAVLVKLAAALYIGVVGPPRNPHRNPSQEICKALPLVEHPQPGGVLINQRLLVLLSKLRFHPAPALLLLAPPEGASKLSLQKVV